MTGNLDVMLPRNRWRRALAQGAPIGALTRTEYDLLQSACPDAWQVRPEKHGRPADCATADQETLFLVTVPTVEIAEALTSLAQMPPELMDNLSGDLRARLDTLYRTENPGEISLLDDAPERLGALFPQHATPILTPISPQTPTDRPDHHGADHHGPDHHGTDHHGTDHRRLNDPQS